MSLRNAPVVRLLMVLVCRTGPGGFCLFCGNGHRICLRDGVSRQGSWGNAGGQQGGVLLGDPDDVGCKPDRGQLLSPLAKKGLLSWPGGTRHLLFESHEMCEGSSSRGLLSNRNWRMQSSSRCQRTVIYPLRTSWLPSLRASLYRTRS